MQSSNANNPDTDPANLDSLVGAMNFAFKKMMQTVNNRLPAQILNYDRTTNRAQVQILISVVTTSGQQVPRAQIASVPVFALGGGNVFINFPLQPGNLGWLCTNDRDISLFLQSYGQNPPNTGRMFDFADAVFIPDVMTGYTINSLDADNAVISTLDGTVRISIGSSGVTITSPTITLNGAVVATGLLTAQGGVTTAGGAGFNMTGNFNMTGEMMVTGDISATGNITPHV